MEWLKIPTSQELYRIRTDEIVGVVANGNYSVIHLYDGRQVTVTFKIHYLDEAFNRLNYNPFVRIGRSIILNKQYVFRINLIERKCYMAGLPITKPCSFNAPRVALEALKKYLETDNIDDKPNWIAMDEGNDDASINSPTQKGGNNEE